MEQVPSIITKLHLVRMKLSQFMPHKNDIKRRGGTADGTPPVGQELQALQKKNQCQVSPRRL